MISVERLTVRYGDSKHLALDALTLGVGAGEIFGLIGPNGAGKTSLLKVLCGLVRPRSGSAIVAGVDVLKNPAGVRRRVGYLPDFFGIYDDLTCREYLDFFAAAQGLPRARREAVVSEVLQLVDLSEKADQLAGALSRGMQQRLGLARVLVHEPDVLLLDEPASGLDPRARVEVREVLRELGRMGKTVILSSHVLADLAVACSSVGILEQGRLMFSGSVRQAIVRAHAADCVVRVACIEGAGRAREALVAESSIDAELDEQDGMLRVTTTVTGDDAESARQEAAAFVGARLFAAGLHVTHLEIERADLERAFMTLTEGRLA